MTQAAEALDLLARALGATEVVRFTAGESVVFAEIEVLGTSITVKDADEHDPVADPGPLLDVVVDDPDAVAGALVDAGGRACRGARAALGRAVGPRPQPVRGVHGCSSSRTPSPPRRSRPSSTATGR